MCLYFETLQNTNLIITYLYIIIIKDFMIVVDMDDALSEVQREHVKECKDSIEWLVRDEIAAAMRSTGK